MNYPLTGIIVAMQEELEVILQSLDKEKTVDRAGMQFHVGHYAGRPVVAVICGIGKVNAALCTQIMISEFKTEQIINLGVAGGLGADIKPGDIVISDSLVQHDMDVSVFDLPKGQIPRLDVFDFKADPKMLQAAISASEQITEHNHFVGRIVTGDQFVASPEGAKALHEDFNALACEMEGASIAHVCHVNHIPFVCIRSISDNANSGAHMDFAQFTPIAVANASVLLQNMIPLCDATPPAHA
ncbi:5'-methylthioadenosine/adenosylhomocysteine nucleosidase [uncultured Paenalcaligenes sp.]|uniref:5'-methylthioadenosine/adenosylhomocysteine nucleosidase n=1 Tax=uncultured Paenalcaligenes sp. TaxID=1588925 RepID=UPI0026257ACA|nr:5'-methylthioadenosine/adenosylhomocysteine nucleosidase [uncultured Paenalcaligenes sp.]